MKQQKHKKLLFVMIFLHIPLLYCMSSISDELNTICSKVDFSIQKDNYLESLLCEVAAEFVDTQSKVNTLTTVLLNKACTIDSEVDLFSSHVEYVQNTVQSIESTQNSMQSIVDKTNSIADNTLSKLCLIDSSIDTIIQNSTITTTTTQLEILYGINSNIDIIAANAQTICNKWITINSSIDGTNSITDRILSSASIIDTQINQIDSRIDRSVLLLSSTINSLVDTIRSVVNTVSPRVLTIESKLCVIDSAIDVINNTTNTITNNINLARTLAVQRYEDFQETWTILNAMQTSLRTTQSLLDVTSNSIQKVQFTTDQSATFTAIRAVELLELTVSSDIDVIQRRMNAINALAYKNTFTVMNTIIRNLSSLDSLLDSLAVTGTVLNAVQHCLGIPIRQADVGTSGLTITDSGHYYLAENIVFSPVGTANAITFGSDNVFIDLGGKYIVQNNTVANVRAFNTDGGLRNNIIVSNGTIKAFNTAGFSGAYTNLFLENVLFEDINVDAINLKSNSEDIVMRRINIFGHKTGDAINIEASRRILLEDSNIMRGTGANSIRLRGDCSEIILRNNKIVNVTSTGIIVSSTQVKRIIIDDCIINSNSSTGISLGTAQSCAVRNCTIKNNSIGISTAGNVNAFVNNIIMNNGIGLSISGSNCAILFNTFINNSTYNIDRTAGAQTYLGNFALHGTETSNYNNILLPKVLLRSTQPIVTPRPTYWQNISMTP